MPRFGTLVLCVQNLDFSGANQVVFNLVAGKVHESNIVVLSPKKGPFAAKFVESGAAVRIGEIKDLLSAIRDVFCVICNTIMTADIIVEMAGRPVPTVWILHEWWTDEMIKDNLKIRNYQGLTLQTVKEAMSVASRIVCVCESQRKLYNPQANSSVIYVGVPDPIPRQTMSRPTLGDLAHDFLRDRIQKSHKVFTFLCLGVICPRKNQLWTVKLFKKFAGNKRNVRLQIVGARYTRQYEIDYLEKLKQEIKHDTRIELYDLTDNVDEFYQAADCLILTSLNEVTPMVIPEALSWGIPVLSTNIAGIREMYEDGVEGFMFSPDNEKKALQSMELIYSNKELREEMSMKGRNRFEAVFDLNVMVESYRQLVLNVAPAMILLDMDGTLVDWDQGFMKQWKKRCSVDRTRSFYIEKCLLDARFTKDAVLINRQRGFFAQLKAMPGAKQALLEMEAAGLEVFIVTTPVKGSKYCAQEKIDWVRQNLGNKWVDRVVITHDKTTVQGDLLIDDKPYDYLFPDGKHTAACWKQIIFDQPYNRQVRIPRLRKWIEWRKVVYPMLGAVTNAQLFELSQIEETPAPTPSKYGSASTTLSSILEEDEAKGNSSSANISEEDMTPSKSGDLSTASIPIVNSSDQFKNKKSSIYSAILSTLATDGSQSSIASEPAKEGEAGIQVDDTLKKEAKKGKEKEGINHVVSRDESEESKYNNKNESYYIGDGIKLSESSASVNNAGKIINNNNSNGTDEDEAEKNKRATLYSEIVK